MSRTRTLMYLTFSLTHEKAIKATKVGQVTLRATVDEVTYTFTLTNVYIMHRNTHNMLSYCKLKNNGVALSYED